MIANFELRIEIEIPEELITAPCGYCQAPVNLLKPYLTKDDDDGNPIFVHMHECYFDNMYPEKKQ